MATSQGQTTTTNASEAVPRLEENEGERERKEEDEEE